MLTNNYWKALLCLLETSWTLKIAILQYIYFFSDTRQIDSDKQEFPENRYFHSFSTKNLPSQRQYWHTLEFVIPITKIWDLFKQHWVKLFSLVINLRKRTLNWGMGEWPQIICQMCNTFPHINRQILTLQHCPPNKKQ